MTTTQLMARRVRGRDAYLLELAVGLETRERYTRHVQYFLQWVVDNDDNAEDVEELDDLLLDYIHELHGTGEAKSSAINTFYGICMFAPELKRKLVRSRQAIKGWNNSEPGRSWPPLTWELTLAIAAQLCRHKKRHYAIALLLAFDCFLRVGELVGLRREDVADDADLRIAGEHKGMILRLRKTKTGANQWVRVLNPDVQLLVRDLLRRTKPKRPLFSFTADQFRRSMKHVCAELGLSPLYVPHSLRHGGATRYYHVLGMPMEDILARGRWASTESARRYIQSGVAMLMASEAPTRVVQLGLEMAKDVLLYLSLSQ